MGKHEVPVASVPVTLLPVMTRVPLANYIAALKDVIERLPGCCGFVV